MSEVLLQKLKESQKNLFVGVAGPGTGKSTAFKAVVNSEQFKDKKVLILTFINKLVDELTSDFKTYKNVTVSTLHSFAKNQLNDVDLDPKLDVIISDDYSYLTGEKINFEEKFHTGEISQLEEEFYRKRRDFYKESNKLYSLSSVIYAVNKLFEKFENRIPNQYDLILIDEFQDFNKVECDFIQFLNKKSKVIVVGDDNQSLYYFKKAQPEKIRELYRAEHTEEFSLDYCYRCTKVIVEATNDLIENAKKKGYLIDILDKKFLYPSRKDKDEISNRFPKINFIPAIQGDLLIYTLEKDIKESIEGKGKKRVLLLVPSYLRYTLYEGLSKKGFNVVEFELFSGEKCNEIKHGELTETLSALCKRKTANLALRKILNLYLDEGKIKSLIAKSQETGKKIWTLLTPKVKQEIEYDLKIFKKVRTGKDPLTDDELLRFNQIYNLKNLLSKLLAGFASVRKDAIEIEMTTVTSSKGLSADFVYYIGIDDKNLISKGEESFSDKSFCEFLVGITRAKEKLTLISLKQERPKILEFISPDLLNQIEN